MRRVRQMLAVTIGFVWLSGTLLAQTEDLKRPFGFRPKPPRPPIGVPGPGGPGGAALVPITLQFTGVAIGSNDEWEPFSLSLNSNVESKGPSEPPHLSYWGGFAVGKTVFKLSNVKVAPRSASGSGPQGIGDAAKVESIVFELVDSDNPKAGSVSLTLDSKDLASGGSQAVFWGSAQTPAGAWKLFALLPKAPVTSGGPAAAPR